MRYYPIFIDLEEGDVLLIGGTEAIAQKIRLVLKTDAVITLISPHATLSEELQNIIEEQGIRIHWLDRSYKKSDLTGKALVYVSTGDAQADRDLSKWARDKGILINVVDDKEACAFITPAIVDRDPVIAAIGTEGKGPVYARSLKSVLESLMPPQLGALVEKAAGYRGRVEKELGEGLPRRKFWDRFFNGPISKAFYAGDEKTVEKEIEENLRGSATDNVGFVSLVGGGPGDPDLLTIKAQRALQQADVVVYDRLVGVEVLEYARRDAEFIPVGKCAGKKSITQEEINRILVKKALDGNYVVRLKGGDPYIFGRGGEEQDVLEATGIAFDVVPGITAVTGCAASMKLPVTHRGRNRSFTILTGMTGLGKPEYNWRVLATKGQIFAFYMGLHSSAHICARLLEHGIDPDTPVTLIENGTRQNERVFDTKVIKLLETIRENDINGPSIIYFGLDREAPSVGFDDGIDYSGEGEIVHFPKVK